MIRLPRFVRVFPAFILAASLFFPFSGCGGAKKQPPKKDYGKPTWLKTDETQLPKLSEDATNLEGGKIVVYDPIGWERQPRGAAKPPKGFNSVIVFQKKGATIMMTKSKDTREIPDLGDDNIEEFAEGAQQLFKTKVQMVRLGGMVGVYFSRRVADAQRLSKFFDRRIVATAINGRLFTYELIADQGKIDTALRNDLFALISKTRIEGMEGNDDSTEGEGVEIAAASPDAGPEEKAAEEKPEAKTEKEEKAEPAVAAVVETKPEETAATTPSVTPPATPPSEEKPEAAAKKPEPKKPEPKKPTPKKPAKKGNTKDILNELDALLN